MGGGRGNTHAQSSGSRTKSKAAIAFSPPYFFRTWQWPSRSWIQPWTEWGALLPAGPLGRGRRRAVRGGRVAAAFGRLLGANTESCCSRAARECGRVCQGSEWPGLGVRGRRVRPKINCALPFPFFFFICARSVQRAGSGGPLPQPSCSHFSFFSFFCLRCPRPCLDTLNCTSSTSASSAR